MDEDDDADERETPTPEAAFPIARRFHVCGRDARRLKTKKSIEGAHTRENTNDHQSPYLSPPMGPNETNELFYNVVKV